MTKHTVASLEVRIAALEASLAERSAQTKQLIAEFAALRTQCDAPKSAPKGAASIRVHAKHTVQIARNDAGGWTVFHNYKPHADYDTFSAGNKAAQQLKLSLENAECN